MTRLKIQLPTTILIMVALVVWVLSFRGVATAFDFHADSAHGNESYGVNRLNAGYDIGDCAHCHETFDPSTCGVNNFMLFFDEILAACAVGCTSCHSNSATWQATENFPYAVNFGGASPIWYGNIYTQFCSANSMPANGGSRHHLGQIWSVIKNNAYDWGFNSDPHPCVACHPPHHAQQNHPVAIVGGKLNTAIRLPSRYKNTDAADLLWGDDEGERMSDYAAQLAIPDGEYQAPYYGDTSDPDWEVSYEPAGDATSDGSNLPDYVTFCMDCHQYAQYDLDANEDVKAIKWGPPWCEADEADIHGAAHANTRDAGSIACMATEGPLRPPYDTHEPGPSNYVLSCLDCHEPHGTYQRPHLIRVKINGGVVADGSFVEICQKCHDMNHPDGACNGCHGHFVGPTAGFHGSVFECSYGVGDCVPGQPDTCPRSF